MRVNPGPHPGKRAYPLGIVLRDVLKVASTGYEVDRILKAGKVKVDGLIRRDPNFAIGLMDIVELAMGQAYRMVPKNSVSLSPVAVEEAEKGLKLIKVTSKTSIRGKRRNTASMIARHSKRPKSKGRYRMLSACRRLVLSTMLLLRRTRRHLSLEAKMLAQ